MKSFTTYRRLMPTTASGDAIAITTIFSSFNQEEIDEIEQYCKDTIGTVLVRNSDLEDGERKADGE